MNRLRELLQSRHLTPADRLFGRHAALRVAVSLGLLEDARADVRWLEAQEPALDQTAKEMLLRARLDLLLAERRTADATRLLRQLLEASAPMVRFHGIVASIFLTSQQTWRRWWRRWLGRNFPATCAAASKRCAPRWPRESGSLM